MESHSSDYIDRGSSLRAGGAKSIDIKFGLPHGLRGFQKSFYQNYIKEKTEKKEKRKGRHLSPRQYISLHEQIKQSKISPNIPKSEEEVPRQSIINRVMNRRNRIKKQHFLQEYLVANKMSPTE